MGALSENARRRIACRVLPDHSEKHASLVGQSDGDASAQLPKRSSRGALDLRWSHQQLLERELRWQSPKRERIRQKLPHCECGRNFEFNQCRNLFRTVSSIEIAA